MTVFLAIVPLFILVALGFVSVRSGYFAASHIPPITELVLKFALPALIFRSLSGVPLSDSIQPGYLLAYALGSLTVYALGMIVARKLFALDTPASGLVAIGVACSNSGFMGYPVVLELLGPVAGNVLAHCMIVENLLMLPLAMAIGTSNDGTARRAEVRGLLLNLIRNPVVVALAAALVVAGFGIAIPGPIQQALDMVANISAPVALFVQGATLAALPLGGLGPRIGLITAMKLIGHPLAVTAAMTAIPGIPPVMAMGGIIFAAMPMLSIYPILTQRAGQSALAASALFAATLACFVTLSILTHLMGLSP